MTTDQDLPPVSLDWLYLLLWLVFCGVGVGAVFAIAMGTTSYLLWAHSFEILAWLIHVRDFIEAMTWTSASLYY